MKTRNIQTIFAAVLTSLAVLSCSRADLTGRDLELHQSVADGNTQRSLALIRSGADIDSLDRGGRTPLMKAIASGHDELAVELIDLGADTSIVDTKNESALMYAARFGSASVVRRLLNYEIQRAAQGAAAAGAVDGPELSELTAKIVDEVVERMQVSAESVDSAADNITIEQVRTEAERAARRVVAQELDSFARDLAAEFVKIRQQVVRDLAARITSEIGTDVRTPTAPDVVPEESNALLKLTDLVRQTEADGSAADE